MYGDMDATDDTDEGAPLDDTEALALWHQLLDEAAIVHQAAADLGPDDLPA